MPNSCPCKSHRHRHPAEARRGAFAPRHRHDRGRRPCVELATQLHAVERAVAEAKRALIHDHIDRVGWAGAITIWPRSKPRPSQHAGHAAQPHFPTPVRSTASGRWSARGLPLWRQGLLAWQLAGADAGLVLGTALGDQDDCLCHLGPVAADKPTAAAGSRAFLVALT